MAKESIDPLHSYSTAALRYIYIFMKQNHTIAGVSLSEPAAPALAAKSFPTYCLFIVYCIDTKT